MRSRPPRKKAPPTPSPLLAALCTPGGNRNAAGFVCLQNQVGLHGWASGRQARQLSREKRLLHLLPSPLWFSVSVPTGSLPPGTTLGSHVSRLRSGGQACLLYHIHGHNGKATKVQLLHLTTSGQPGTESNWDRHQVICPKQEPDPRDKQVTWHVKGRT